jgi:hypothetical protein
MGRSVSRSQIKRITREERGKRENNQDKRKRTKE